MMNLPLVGEKWKMKLLYLVQEKKFLNFVLGELKMLVMGKAQTCDACNLEHVVMQIILEIKVNSKSS